MRKIWLGGLLALCLLACRQQEAVEPTEEAAELTFLLELPPAASRGQAEDVADGQYLYTVSVYLLDENRRLAASQENVPVDNQPEKMVRFDKSYQLKRGIYTLMAVANHADHVVEGTTYRSGLSSAWTATDYDALLENQISASTTDNVSPKNWIQPLSLMKEIELHAGNNEVEGELVRTFARFRLEVRNNSGEVPLVINNLTFSNNFTQKQAYVFDDGTDRKYFGPTGAPAAKSALAIQPFTTDEGKNYKTIPARASAVLFDSYLLESKAASGVPYTYTLDLSYEGLATTSTHYKRTGDAISRPQNVSVGAESYFLLYNTSTKKYLNANGNRVGQSSLSNNELTSLGTHCVWQLVKNGDSYYIRNLETGTYIQSPSGNTELGTNPVSYTLNEKSSNRNYYIRLKSNDRFINVTNNGIGFTNNNSTSGTYFYLYRVTKETITTPGEKITFNDPIHLTTIDPVTQQSSETKTIRRNDFIHVMVTVSYNPEAGKFEFKVEDWGNVSGEVEFY